MGAGDAGFDPTPQTAVAKILLVDDRPANLLALEGILAPLGHVLLRALSGQEALKHLLNEEVAVILLDVEMPGMDGFETAAFIRGRDRTSKIPILFVTAISSDAEHVFKGYSTGAVDYLVKPIDPEILRSKVSVFVDLYLKGEQIKAQERLLRDREIEALQRSSSERYARLADAMPMPLWRASADGKVYYANRAWSAYSGLETPSDSLFDARAVHRDDLGAVKDAWTRCLAEGTPLEAECRLRRVDGEYRWHLFRALPERTGVEAIEAWMVTATDIDARKRAEEERMELLARAHHAREAAEAASRAKDAFLAMVSHELRTPLNAILGWAGMLRSGMLDPSKTERALQTIERNAHLQAHLVEDLLDVSRIVSGKLHVVPARIRLAEVARLAVETVRLAAEAKGIAVELSCSDPDELSGDGDRLQQVVWNLVSNALKFTPAGGRIEVRIARRETEIELSVKDTGSGIDAAFLPHVFDGFRQGEDAPAGYRGGLGLGLAIVRHIVELHGGVVSAESAGRGHGSLFRVRLPIRLLHDARPWEETSRSQPTGTGEMNPRLDGIHILFVDDQTDARELFTAIFEEHGARVATAASTEHALDLLTTSWPDVLVSDIGLPGDDGYAFIRQVRRLEAERGTSVPAIAVTAHSGADQSSDALTAGFQVHLAKPVDPAELIALVASLADAQKP